MHEETFTGGGDGIGGERELLKYGGVYMVKMLGKLYALICSWKEECVPMKWREGLIVSLKGDKEDPGNLEVFYF